MDCEGIYLIKNNANRHFGALLHASVSTIYKLLVVGFVWSTQILLVICLTIHTFFMFLCVICCSYLLMVMIWFEMGNSFQKYVEEIFFYCFYIHIDTIKYADDDDEMKRVGIFMWVISFFFFFILFNNQFESFIIFKFWFSFITFLLTIYKYAVHEIIY